MKKVYTISSVGSIVKVFDSAEKQALALEQFIEEMGITEDEIHIAVIDTHCVKYSFDRMADSPYKVLYLETWEVL